MPKIIIVDNCTQCPYFFRFQNPKLGRICLGVKDPKTKAFRTIRTAGDETPDWCPLHDKVERPITEKLDRYTIKFIQGLGHVDPGPQYCDAEFKLSLKDWDQILKKVRLRRTISGTEDLK